MKGLSLEIGQHVRLLPQNRIAQVYRVEERRGRYLVGLIFEDTREAQEYIFNADELQERLQVLPLEQRMGCIHRYGQKRDCLIFNFVAANTREGQVLERLLERLREIRRELGSDQVFDVVGEVIPANYLERLSGTSTRGALRRRQRLSASSRTWTGNASPTSAGPRWRGWRSGS